MERATMANGAFATAAGIQNVDALLGGTKWNSSSLTYNFPNDLSYYPATYGGDFSIFSNPSSFQSATTAVRNTVAWALQEQFMKVTNLTFTQVGATAAADTSIAGIDIPGFGGYGYFPIVPGGSTTAADLQRQGDYWYDSPQTARFATIVRGDNSWRGVMHEIGHTLGLKHGHETGGLANTVMTADRDSMEFSIMTYRKFIGAAPNGDSFADVEKYGAAQTLMMYDIAALQQLYGANYANNSGNTVYTWSTTTGEMFVDGIGQGAAGANRVFMTLWDGNGFDTYDLSNYTTNLQIDLTPGGWSVFDPVQLSIIGVAEGIKARGNVFNALAFNDDPRSLVESAIGGSGNDTIVGNGADNVLAGKAGNDVLKGMTGNDYIDGGPGADTIDGGAGFDLATWLNETSGLTLNLANQALNAGSALGDTVTNVEAFYLTNFVDNFTGGTTGVFVYGFDGNDTITGSSVSDIIDGGPGADTIDAGGGFDYVSYYSSASGVTVDIKNPVNNTGDAKGDVVTNAEAYILTSKGDTFVGTDSGQNIVFGYEGNDTLKGGFNANNWFFAGDGNDRMVGGGVQDLFVGGNGADTIVLATPKPIAGSSVFGFTPGTDVLEISRAAFGLSAGYSVSAGSTLVSGTSPVATTTQPTFFYYTNLGLLYFDPDGTGSTAATLLVQFDTHPALTAADFHLI
jgi:serralysin